MSNETTETKSSRQAAEDLVAAVDTGSRNVPGAVGQFIALGALAWSLFQLWIASPLPFMLADYIPLMNNTQTRPIHLCFAVVLAFLSYPALKSSPRRSVPITDWLFAAVSAICILYLVVEADDLAGRMGIPTTADIVTAGFGLVLLLEATRRSLGIPLMAVALVFLAYIFFGQYGPDVIAWKGASFEKAMSHLWITQEGVFGIGVGVSTSFIFLFVLFGALMDKSGAGIYLTKLSIALVGHMRGGPAKAAVVSSAMTGLISGSSLANVVTTGAFTIPLMKRTGFPAEKAGAVEVASSTNGQLTPPVMGAAAFIMIERVGIDLVEIMKHAFLPAIISYIALVYIVHLEAVKAGMTGLPRSSGGRTLLQKLLSTATVVVGFIVLMGVTYFGFGWTKQVFGSATIYIASVVLLIAYAFLLKLGAKYEDGRPEDLENMTACPEMRPTFMAGLYFLLPIGVLVWCLIVERFSPGLAAFWTSVVMLVVALTHKAGKAFFRGEGVDIAALGMGRTELYEGLVSGARNMVPIGVAVAVAGIVVGAVTLTGLGQKMTEFVEFVSAGNLMLMLIFTAIICLVLGLGLPTTANYIVVSSLMAPVIVTLSAEAGVILPLIAVHLFVFYFGILADDTPPVGLAAYAAAALSGGDPIKTGLQGFAYDIRTAILPFLFIFNTQLLMIGIDGVMHFIITVVTAILAMLMFASATQSFFIVRNKIWESAALLLIAFTLFRPGFWLDMVADPFVHHDPVTINQVAEGIPANGEIRLMVEGETIDGDTVSKAVLLPLGDAAPGADRLANVAGLELRFEDGKALVDNLGFGSPAEQAGIDFDWQIIEVMTPADRMPKEVFFIPAIGLLVLVYLMQRARRGRREID
ncbi:MAG: TRAP transporter permease [Nisaea sp.]|uniref:TRAP transporter permease n=1 Tax=Nisaea sp. TaxID=2024842 RepID=UPI001B056685|nr:TRAP transporter permease [Nisaea sp.]MBO6562991.1 TRAP transporter permease [Nisaea sp.]